MCGSSPTPEYQQPSDAARLPNARPSEREISAAERLDREMEDRRQAEQAFRDSEARMRAIVNTAVDGIITIDEQGIVETVNPAAERIFGYAAHEMIGRNVNMLMPSPDRERHDQYLQNYVRTGIKKIIGVGREVEGRRKDGTVFPMDLAVSEVLLGSRRLFTGLVRDITLRKRAEEELRQAKESAERAKEAAEAANKAKDHFLAVLSHELRTPLTPVLATVAYVETQADLPPELRDEIGTIRRNVEMEARLIDDLLDLTRISRGKIQLRSETVDAHAVLRAALEICQTDLEAKDIEVALALRAKQHHVRGDSARLQQVFWNLIKNAVKFTPEGGRVELRSVNTEDGRLRLTVSDSGMGIAPEVLPRIFNAFEQGENRAARQFGGLGLGLTISKALVDMQGGTLSAQSAGVNQGATFIVEMPTVSPAQDQATPPVAVARPSAGKGRKPLKILLVEDHEDTLRVMSSLLRHYGYEVRTAATVQRALELANREKFDLLISDLGLPDGSGLDVMREIRSHYGTRGIALSGFGMDEDVRRSLEAGFEQHLTKPINPQTLELVIQRVAS